MYDVYKYVHGNGVAGRRDSFTVAVDIDIHGYPCVDIKLSASMHGNVISVVFELLMTLLSASALTTQISCCY